jgi:hypothetical protein
MEAVKLAASQWVRLTWDQGSNTHKLATCKSKQEPQWPNLPMRDLLELAFRDYLIEDLSHPVLRKLRGE